MAMATGALGHGPLPPKKAASNLGLGIMMLHLGKQSYMEPGTQSDVMSVMVALGLFFQRRGAGLTGALLWCFIHVPLRHHGLAGEMQMT